MTQPRLLMRQIREVLDLHFDRGLSQREIARALGVARSTVERVFKRHAAAGLGWPPDPALTDVDLEQRLYQRAPHAGRACIQARPDYAQVVRELGRKGVTRLLSPTEN